jgi:type II secretory pathway pseudopilin PulG
MLVVLTLIGIMAGIALPNFSRMLDSYTTATRWKELEGELNELPIRALNEGRAIVLTTASLRDILTALPADWSAEVTSPVRYQMSGWCEGGTLRVAPVGGAARILELVAPRCLISGE